MPRLSIAILLVILAGCEFAAGPAADPAADDPPPADPKANSPVARRDRIADVPDLGTRHTGIDWPDFLGPDRNSKSPETGILTEWPAGGPPIVWTRRLGTGYGIGSISRGRLFQMDRQRDRARLTCIHSETGDELWQFEYPTDYEDLLGYNNGPRCSPVVDDDRVYIYGAGGMLHCLDTVDGTLRWKVDTQKEFNVVQNFFGVGSTPLVEGDLLIAQVGGSPPGSPETYSGRVRGNGSGIVAFDKYTGEEKYRVTDELASYASPVAATIGERRLCLSFSRGGLVALDAARGDSIAYFPWRARLLESVNASTPLVLGNRVFITETYGPGSCMLQLGDDRWNVLWSDKDRARNKSMQAHWNTPVYHEGYIYGSSGRHLAEAELRCIDARDGSVQWSEPGLTRSSLLYADGHFLCLGEDGTLRLIRATHERYEAVAQAVLRKDGRKLITYPAWSAPILSHGLLYVRGSTHLVCLELIPAADGDGAAAGAAGRW